MRMRAKRDLEQISLKVQSLKNPWRVKCKLFIPPLKSIDNANN